MKIPICLSVEVCRESTKTEVTVLQPKKYKQAGVMPVFLFVHFYINFL